MLVNLIAEVTKHVRSGEFRGRNVMPFDWFQFSILERIVDSRFKRIHVDEMKWLVQMDVPAGRGQEFVRYVSPGDLIQIHRGVIRPNVGAYIINIDFWRPPALTKIGKADGHIALWDDRAIARLEQGALIDRKILGSAEPSTPLSKREFEKGVPFQLDMLETWTPGEDP